MPELEGKDVYEEIVDDHVGAESKEEKQPVTETTKETKEEVSSVENPSVISKEFVEKHKLSESFVGKPFDELAQTYKNLQKLDSKLSQQVADLSKKFSDLETRIPKKEVVEAVKEVEEKLPEYDMTKFVDNDGYVVDRKGLEKYNEDYFTRREKLLEKKFDKLIASKTKELEDRYTVTGKSVEDLKAKEYQAELYDEVSDGLKKLYEDVDEKLINEVFKQFGESLAEEDEETQKQMIDLYKGKPKKFAKDILNYHKANLPKEAKSDSEKATEEVHKKQVEKLKNSEKKFTKAGTSAREHIQKSGDQPYDELLSDAMEDADRFSESRSQVKRE